MSGPYGSVEPPAVLIAWDDSKGAWIATSVMSFDKIEVAGPSSQPGPTAIAALAGLMDARFCILADQDCPATMIEVRALPELSAKPVELFPRDFAEAQRLIVALRASLDRVEAQRDHAEREWSKAVRTAAAAGGTPAEALERLRQQIINTPETADFMAGVPIEAAHQRERWASDHDAGKSPFDWFWLIGYLAQKAADAATRGDAEKAKHHTISTAAALSNWHAALAGTDTSMRPGIDPSTLAADLPEGNADGVC